MGDLVRHEQERVKEETESIVVLDVKDGRDVLVGPHDDEGSRWRDAEVVVDVLAAFMVAVVVRPDLIVVCLSQATTTSINVTCHHRTDAKKKALRSIPIYPNCPFAGLKLLGKASGSTDTRGLLMIVRTYHT
jgi:hypothetical protein